MTSSIRQASSTACSTLATDLDGTFIPLPDQPQNRSALDELKQIFMRDDRTLVFVTGRHFESVMEVAKEAGLPWPHWLICDVGTSIFEHVGQGEFQPVDAYQQHQATIVSDFTNQRLRTETQSISGLRLQEEEKQGPFKLSFYVDATRLDQLAAEVRALLEQLGAPYSIIHSVDPFNGDGLIDLLPADISKAAALRWWSQFSGTSDESIVFSGDSGNDLAALTSGYRAIVVGNAARSVAAEAHRVHRQQQWNDRLYLARGQATSGVLEGCQWFELASMNAKETYPIGATPVTCQQTHFRVWAPRRERVEVEVIRGDRRQRHPLERGERGYFSGNASPAQPGDRYLYALDDEVARPDPASRYQPGGVHEPSEIVDPQTFPWTDDRWQGVAKRDLAIYELHVGAFTSDGTFRAAIQQIPRLQQLGVTAVELMPVAQTPGKWNWGYDGVNLFAVNHNYGTPNDLKAFVDACHAAGLAVILDVVYNHVGPEGNYWSEFGPYYSPQRRTPWGDGFNFDGRRSAEVRKYIVDNALFWLDEYHLDGLRLDAAHFMRDDSELSILDEIRDATAEFEAAAGRTIHLIAETNVYDPEVLRDDGQREAYDAIWCDCLMHAIYSQLAPGLRLTPRDYLGGSDIADVLAHGRLYVGRDFERRTAERGDPSAPSADALQHVPSLVMGLQTHDAVGNHPHGKRIHQLSSKAAHRAAAALTMLYPSIPILFMGEEVAAESPFPFFADFQDRRLRRAVDKGRTDEYPHHDWGDFPLPSSRRTFRMARLDDSIETDAEMLAWYQKLLTLRKEGIAEGWLAVDRLVTAHDQQRDIFELRYGHPQGGVVCVCVRLTRPTDEANEPIETPIDGQVVLSSEPNAEVRDGGVALESWHAVVSRSEP